MLVMLLKEREKRESEKEDAGGPKHMAVRTSPLSSNVALPRVLLFFAAVGLLDAWLFFKGCIAAPELLDPDALYVFFWCYFAVVVFTIGVGLKCQWSYPCWRRWCCLQGRWYAKVENEEN